MVHDPIAYGIKHDEWRQHQPEAIEWMMSIEKSGVLEAPTGSGKTAIARVSSAKNRTVSLVKTKALQAENYEQEYNFVPLYGKSNYRCIHPQQSTVRCDECMFDEMPECPHFAKCEYIIARNRAQGSQRAALNYAYWLNAYTKWPHVDMLVCDEGHQLSEITLDWAGCTINNGTRLKWDLPSFPIIGRSNGGGAIHKKTPSESIAETWLKKVEDQLASMRGYAEDQNDLSELQSLQSKVRATSAALLSGVGEWFIRSGPSAIQSAGGTTWGFVARPLTAKHHFHRYFMAPGRRMMIMSATIGNFETFGIELGLTQPLTTHRVPSVWHPSTRPVHALDVPRIGRKSTPAALEKQVDGIASAIKSVNPTWSGLVHVTSKKDARRIAEGLSRRGLHDRIYVSPSMPTNKMIRKWQERKAAFPNSIMITWAFWEGYNGLDERINIVAKMPYPFLGDQYEVERRNYDGKFFLQRTAWQLEQGLGRTRRGRIEDYDTNGQKNGLVAIADGQWKYLRKYMSAGLAESIV